MSVFLYNIYLGRLLLKLPNTKTHLELKVYYAFLLFAISAVFALAGCVKIAKILTAAGFILLIVMLFAVWQETYPR
jgi:hypothetical protein